ncbi:MAG: MBL fold metallo-hydrolase, partial [Flexistipes sinusarabici]
MQIKKHTLQTPYPVGPVHFYTFETDEYTLIFDTGPRTEEASEYLAKIFDNKKQKYLFITHCHVDHYGMLDFFEKRSDTEIFISKYDLFKFDRVDERLGNLKRLLAGEGFPEDIISSVEGSLRYFKYSVPFPKRYNVLEENEKYVSELGIAFERCPGHSQSDILYKIGGSAVSGDIILRNIFQTPLLDMDFHDIDRRFRNY